MTVIGKTSEELAIQFVQSHPEACLGSRAKCGLRRVLVASTGAALKTIKEQFRAVAVTMAQPETKAKTKSSLPDCVHRGSQRKTCCGSPELWICRELKTDCVASSSDAEKLMQMVGTSEAASIPVCQTCPHRKADAAGNALRVGFLSATYMEIGGTETFHRSLLPRLKNAVNVAGFVATAFHGGDGAKLQVPYATGIDAARQLATACDVVVVWGIQHIASILPANRPRVIAVHHSDWSSEWNNNLVLTQRDLIDEVICVNEHAAAELASRGLPVYYIPNAIDPERVTPSGKQFELRSKHQIPDALKIVLFGHRLNIEKRPLLAVEIAQQLPDDWVMVIVGDGRQRVTVEAASVGCDRVRIVGACDSLADWLSISDCFLSLSTFEGFGLAIGEAMAAGVPTVSTPTGIAPGLATTLPADSTAEQWAYAIVNAKARVQPAEILDRFSVAKMVDAWSKIVNS